MLEGDASGDVAWARLARRIEQDLRRPHHDEELAGVGELLARASEPFEDHGDIRIQGDQFHGGFLRSRVGAGVGGEAP